MVWDARVFDTALDIWSEGRFNVVGYPVMWPVNVGTYFGNQLWIILSIQVGLELWGALQEEVNSSHGIVACNPCGAPGKCASMVP